MVRGAELEERGRQGGEVVRKGWQDVGFPEVVAGACRPPLIADTTLHSAPSGLQYGGWTGTRDPGVLFLSCSQSRGHPWAAVGGIPLSSPIVQWGQDGHYGAYGLCAGFLQRRAVTYGILSSSSPRGDSIPQVF